MYLCAACAFCLWLFICLRLSSVRVTMCVCVCGWVWQEWVNSLVCFCVFVSAVVNAFFKQIANHCLTIVLPATAVIHFPSHTHTLSLSLSFYLSLFVCLCGLWISDHNDSDLVFGSKHFTYAVYYIEVAPFCFSVFCIPYSVYSVFSCCYGLRLNFGFQSLMYSFKNGIWVICQWMPLGVTLNYIYAPSQVSSSVGMYFRFLFFLFFLICQIEFSQS